MPRFGVHISTAARGGTKVGGLPLAIDRARELACQSIQIFLRPPAQWPASSLKDADIHDFRLKSADADLTPLLAHTIYLINLASPKPELYKKSRLAFLDEIDHAEALGIDFLVTHPGAHRGAGEEAGLKRIAKSLNYLHKNRPKAKVRILLETTAGQGTALCGRLEHLAFLLENTAMPERLGVCLDTCHMFAAGYDLKSPKGYRATLEEIDKSIGFGRVAAIHMNDCKGPRGSRLDRHEHIGKGTLGLAAFRRIVNEPLFKHLPMILETPKTNDAGKEMDPVNLAVLRRSLKKKK